MFFAAGIGAYHIAIFHLFTHAFFKALLFLGSGSIIHSFKNQQDLRQMGGVWKKLPYTWILMLIGTLALTGFPFLSGFYSKEAIIEFAYLKDNTIGYYVCFIGILTAFLTAIYSWRLLFKAFHGKYNNTKYKIKFVEESPYVMLIPLILLGVGAVFSGFFFKELFIGENNNEFWDNSILFLNTIEYHKHPPMWFLFITPFLVISAIPISYYLIIKNKVILKNFIQKNQHLYNFLLNKWYFDELYTYLFINPIKKIGLFFWKSGDTNTIDRYGPDGFSKVIKNVSNKAVQFQSGYLYHYAFVMLIGLSLLLTYFVLN